MPTVDEHEEGQAAISRWAARKAAECQAKADALRPGRRDEGGAMDVAVEAAALAQWNAVSARRGGWVPWHELFENERIEAREGAAPLVEAAAPIIAADAAERAREEALAPIRALLEQWDGLDDADLDPLLMRDALHGEMGDQ